VSADYVYETLDLENINPIWEVGKVLADRDADTRNIYTYIDTDNDYAVDTGEWIAFNAANESAIKPYLGVMDDTAWSYLGATQDERTTNLIAYARGTDIDGLRPRTIGGKVWKLGDIVHSTPVTIAKPADNYHIIYGDESYQEFYDDNRNRETAIYVGANDGMLHAFTSYVYDSSLGQYTQPTGRETIGEELWAYIPQVLLPHLKWLPDPEYTHVYFVDFKPKVFDAKIGDPLITGGDPQWRTILLCGLNMGGKHIWAEGDFNDGNGVTTRHFYPSYICMDVTDPLNPVLLWERSYTDLGMTVATPAVIRIKNDEYDQHGSWYAVFGSGPTDYDGSSSLNGYVFVVDLKTGDPIDPTRASDWLFDTGVSNTYMNTPASLDKNLTDNVDAVYFGDSAGNAFHVSTRASDTPSTNPADWTLHNIYSGPRPITASVSLSVDAFDDVWVYFGTGSFLTDADKVSSDQEYIVGIRDPVFSGSSSTLPLDFSNLFDADPYTIYTNRDVDSTGGLSRITDWYSLLRAVRNTEDQTTYPDYYDGWYRSLEPGSPSERVVTKPAILGGAVYLPAFTPTDDVCGFGGTSNFYALYYETGTAYYKPLLSDSTVAVSGETYKEVKEKVSLGEGMPPPSVGIHVGRQKGAKAFLQMSTGEVVEVKIEPAFNIKSGLTTWRSN
jgi:type IV pilus assembly protein PilY1